MQTERADILDVIKAYEPELIAIRHDIHRHPETGFEEFRTARVVADKLRGWGIDVAEGLAKTGVVGTVRGARPGQRAIGLRADLDALHIEEAAGREHRSTVPGKMHACGHDGHTAMLLGAARYLAEHRDFAGEVHFVFQPAEEGLGGGRVMVEEGLFDRFPVDAVYGMHNAPSMAFGAFATRKGPFLAASDTWTATFLGTGGHGGAAAHLATDTTIATAQFVMAIQTIVSRSVKATETAVVSVGHIAGGDFNSPAIIPAKMVVRGTARSYTPEVRDLLEKRLGELARSTAAAHGCTVEFDYLRRYPPLVNHPEQTDIAAAAARALVGGDNVNAEAPLVTGSEDFSFMLNARPGAFVLIGAGAQPDGSVHEVHTPRYDFNDEILTLGAGYWVSLVHEELG
jgi:hippurate hydrolase